MIVKMRTNYAGPVGTVRAGREINLPLAQAKELIDGGYAVKVGSKEASAGPPPEMARQEAVETAATTDAPEQTVKRTRRNYTRHTTEAETQGST